jgi:predicted DNA-binding ribbon-helix-helix protein
MPALEKRSLNLAGHRTSLALEGEFWAALARAAAARDRTLTQFIEEIDLARGPRSLASACRLAALAFVAGEGRA